MSRHEHLHIYQEAYKFSKLLFGCVAHFDRNWKYHLGEKLIVSSMDTMLCIAEINSLPTSERKVLFARLRKLTATSSLLLRIADDHKLFGGMETYLRLIEHLASVRKMSEKWG